MTGKKYRVVALILAVVILAAGGVLCYRHFHQTAQSVTAEASAETAAAGTVIFRQKDDRWKDDALGDSAYHMADSGCLTCCVAAALQMQQISVDGLPEDADAGAVNQFFSDRACMTDREICSGTYWNK
mgnify:CR=1 FL=1